MELGDGQGLGSKEAEIGHRPVATPQAPGSYCILVKLGPPGREDARTKATKATTDL